MSEKFLVENTTSPFANVSYISFPNFNVFHFNFLSSNNTSCILEFVSHSYTLKGHVQRVRLDHRKKSQKHTLSVWPRTF